VTSTLTNQYLPPQTQVRCGQACSVALSADTAGLYAADITYVDTVTVVEYKNMESDQDMEMDQDTDQRRTSSNQNTQVNTIGSINTGETPPAITRRKSKTEDL